MAKAGACQELEILAVVAEETIPNGRECKLEGDVKMLFDTIIPAIGFLAICLLIYWRAQKC